MEESEREILTGAEMRAKERGHILRKKRCVTCGELRLCAPGIAWSGERETVRIVSECAECLEKRRN